MRVAVKSPCILCDSVVCGVYAMCIHTVIDTCSLPGAHQTFKLVFNIVLSHVKTLNRIGNMCSVLISSPKKSIYFYGI